jgi:hypothetical protein
MRFLAGLFLVWPMSLFAEVKFHDAWARATAPGMPMGAVYAEIENTGSENVTLVSVETSSARLAEIHESVEVNGMMRMREITPFVVEAGEIVSFRPAGKHIMLMGLKDALEEGQTLTLTATFSDGQAVAVEAVIGGFGQMTKPK